VFRGRVVAGLGKFRGGCIAADGRGRTDLGRLRAAFVQAGGGLPLPATIMQNQSLSASAIGVVAWAPSHGRSGSAVFCGREGACRLIASLPTQRLGAAQLGPVGGSGEGGAVPLSPRAPAPYARRDRANWKVRKSGQPIGAALPLATGSAVALSRARNLSRLAMGSGVWGTLSAATSGAKTRGILRFSTNRVGVNRGAHVSLDLGRAATLGGARG
jgi:hypothetical protein